MDKFISQTGLPKSSTGLIKYQRTLNQEGEKEYLNSVTVRVEALFNTANTAMQWCIMHSFEYSPERQFVMFSF